MQIRSSLLPSMPRAASSAPGSKNSLDTQSSVPSDSVSFSGGDSALALGTFGAVTGAVGIAGPAALGMGAVKAFMTGHPLAGVGLGAACIVAGATVAPISLMGAAMSTDAGSSAGINGYMAGAAAGTLAAGFAIF